MHNESRDAILLDGTIALDIARIAANLNATEKAGHALKSCLSTPPEYGSITLHFNNGKLYRVGKEESF